LTGRSVKFWDKCEPGLNAALTVYSWHSPRLDSFVPDVLRSRTMGEILRSTVIVFMGMSVTAAGMFVLLYS
jgi:hypothetical protein